MNSNDNGTGRKCTGADESVWMAMDEMDALRTGVNPNITVMNVVVSERLAFTTMTPNYDGKVSACAIGRPISLTGRIYSLSILEK